MSDKKKNEQLEMVKLGLSIFLKSNKQAQKAKKAIDKVLKNEQVQKVTTRAGILFKGLLETEQVKKAKEKLNEAMESEQFKKAKEVAKKQGAVALGIAKEELSKVKKILEDYNILPKVDKSNVFEDFKNETGGFDLTTKDASKNLNNIFNALESNLLNEEEKEKALLIIKTFDRYVSEGKFFAENKDEEVFINKINDYLNGKNTKLKTYNQSAETAFEDFYENTGIDLNDSEALLNLKAIHQLLLMGGSDAIDDEQIKVAERVLELFLDYNNKNYILPSNQDEKDFLVELKSYFNNKNKLEEKETVAPESVKETEIKETAVSKSGKLDQRFDNELLTEELMDFRFAYGFNLNSFEDLQELRVIYEELMDANRLNSDDMPLVRALTKLDVFVKEGKVNALNELEEVFFKDLSENINVLNVKADKQSSINAEIAKLTEEEYAKNLEEKPFDLNEVNEEDSDFGSKVQQRRKNESISKTTSNKVVKEAKEGSKNSSKATKTTKVLKTAKATKVATKSSVKESVIVKKVATKRASKKEESSIKVTPATKKAKVR